MKKALVLLALVATLSVVLSEENHVVELTKDTFAAEIKKGDVVLVEFFAPWCGHCKALAPEFAKAAETLKGKATLASVDCTVEKELATKYGIEGFPTLKVFKNGDLEDPTEYKGGRTADDIVSTMEKLSGPAYVDLADAAAVEEFKNANNVAVIGFFSGESAEREQFRATAEKLRDILTFGETAVGGKSGVHIFKKGEDSIAHSGEDLAEFLKGNMMPLLDAIGPDNYMNYMEVGLPLVWLCAVPETEETKKAEDAVRAAAAQFKGKLSFVTLDAKEYEGQVTALGLTGNVIPAVALLNETAHYSYDESAEITTDGIVKFCNQFLAGELTPSIRSDPVPETNDAPVTVVVGSQFEEIVQNKDKDVLIEFYAPWCGHCKQLAPIYDKLGAALVEYDSVVIAKMDATTNEPPPQFEVEGFPTIMFFPAGEDQSKPLKYEGGRTFDAMVSFLQKNAKSTDIDIDNASSEVLSFFGDNLKKFKTSVEKLVASKKSVSKQLKIAKDLLKEAGKLDAFDAAVKALPKPAEEKPAEPQVEFEEDSEEEFDMDKDEL